MAPWHIPNTTDGENVATRLKLISLIEGLNVVRKLGQFDVVFSSKDTPKQLYLLHYSATLFLSKPAASEHEMFLPY